MLPLDKVRDLISKHSVLEKELSSGQIDKKKFAEKSKEYSELSNIIKDADLYNSFENDKKDLEKIINDEKSDKDMKEYNRILESELKNVLTELGEYNDIYSRYKTFIKEKAEKVLDGEIAWNKGLENELKKLYKGIIDKRDQLTTRVEGYKKKERYPLKNYGHSAA